MLVKKMCKLEANISGQMGQQTFANDLIVPIFALTSADMEILHFFWLETFFIGGSLKDGNMFYTVTPDIEILNQQGQ